MRWNLKEGGGKSLVRRTGIKKGIQKQLEDAQVNHCLTFEQVADEMVNYYKIPSGSFDPILECSYHEGHLLD